MNLKYRSPDLAARIRELIQQPAVALDQNSTEDRMYRFIQQARQYVVEQQTFEDTIALNLQCDSIGALPNVAENIPNQSTIDPFGLPQGFRGGELEGSRGAVSDNGGAPSRGDDNV